MEPSKVFEHGGGPWLVWACGARRWHCFGCLASFEINEDDTAASVWARAARHAKAQHGVDERTGYEEAYTGWIGTWIEDALGSVLKSAPIHDFKTIRGNRPLPPNVKQGIVSLCMQCLEIKSNAKHSKCECPKLMRASFPGILSNGKGLGKSRITPFATEYPKPSADTRALQQLVIDRGVRAEATRAQHAQVLLELRAENQRLMELVQLSERWGGLSNGLQGLVPKFDVLESSSAAAAEFAGTTAGTRLEQFVRSVGLAGKDQDALRQYYEARQPASGVAEGLVVQAVKDVMQSGNASIGSMGPSAQQALWSAWGGMSARADSFGSIGEYSAKRYAQTVDHLVLVVYRSHTHFGDAFRKDTEVVVDGLRNGMAESKARLSMQGIVIRFMYDAFVRQPNAMIGTMAREALRCLFVDVEDAGRQAGWDEGDSDFEGGGDDDLYEPAVHGNIGVARAADISRRLAAVRFFLGCLVVLAFDHQQVFNGRIDFINAHASAEFPRDVLAHLGAMRRLGEKLGEERDSIVVQVDDRGYGLVANQSVLHTEDFSKGITAARRQFVDKLAPEEGVLRVLLEELVFGELVEADWTIAVSNGRFVLKGKGFAAVRAQLERMARTTGEAYNALVQQLKLAVCFLVTLESSGLLRMTQLFRLHARVDEAKSGSLVLSLGNFPGFSTLEINGNSTKHDTNQGVSGHLGPVLSKLAAIVYIAALQVWDEALLAPWLEPIAELGGENRARYRQTVLLQACEQRYSLALKQVDDPAPFDELTIEERGKLLQPAYIRSFETRFTALASGWLGVPNLGARLLRKLIATLNDLVPAMLKTLLELGLLDANRARLATQHLASLAAMRGARQGFGDGAAHTLKTLEKYYAGKGQGTSYNFTEREVAVLLLRGKMILLGDQFVTRQHDAKQETLERKEIDVAQATLNVEAALGKTLYAPQETAATYVWTGKSFSWSGSCGSGKTVLMLLAASQFTSGIVVYLVPFVALLQGVAEACGALGVECSVFKIGEDNVSSAPNWAANSTVRVVLAVYDTAMSAQFVSWVGAMHTARKLVNALVLDEAHEMVAGSAYRPVMTRLAALTGVADGVPIAVLSGTITYSMVEWIKGELGLDEGVPLIESGVELNNWSCMTIQAVEGDLLDAGLDMIPRQLPDEGKTLVFVTRRDDVGVLASSLRTVLSSDVEVLEAHSKRTAQQNAAVMSRMLTKGGSRVVTVATSGMAQGVDYPDVCRVIVLGAYSLLEVTQMFGRCGRDGKGNGRVYLLESLQTDFQHQDGKTWQSLADLGINDPNAGSVFGRGAVQQVVRQSNNGNCAAAYIAGKFVGGSSRNCERCSGCMAALAGYDGEQALGDEHQGLEEEGAAPMPGQQAVVVARQQLDLLNVDGKRQRGIRPATPREVQLANRWKSASIGRGNFCYVCGQSVKYQDHYPNKCPGVMGWIQDKCNYCLGKHFHKRPFGAPPPAGCCDVRTTGFCWCARQECRRAQSGKEYNGAGDCVAGFTFRCVLAAMWFMPVARTALQREFEDTRSFTEYKQLYDWAIKMDALVMEGGVTQILGCVLGLWEEGGRFQ